MHTLTDDQLLQLTEAQLSEILQQDGAQALWVMFRLQALARKTASGQDAGKVATQAPASTPSSQIPPYEKPRGRKRSRKRGRKKGHAGARRAAPPQVDEEREHLLEVCPVCGKPLGPPCDARTRIVEDIDRGRATATRHTVHRHSCPGCRKRFEAKVTDALPRSQIGHRTTAFTAWLHYGLGQTTSQILSVLNAHFRLPVSAGGLSQLWMRTAKILRPWYDRIADEARASAVLNADETGWRVNGKTHWLWCFTTPALTCYTIDRSRSSQVVREFLADSFGGKLVTDFYGAYNLIEEGNRQFCLAHLLREFKEVSRRNSTREWQRFAKKAKRIFRDALRLRFRRDQPNYASLVGRIRQRLDMLVKRTKWTDPDCLRLAKRLVKAQHGLFLFLDHEDVPADNNRAEREIRPAVIARKTCFHNTSADGADAQSIFMTTYRTLKLRGHNPIETIVDALTKYTATDCLPELPRPPDLTG
jgi:transposase